MSSGTFQKHELRSIVDRTKAYSQIHTMHKDWRTAFRRLGSAATQLLELIESPPKENE